MKCKGRVILIGGGGGVVAGLEISKLETQIGSKEKKIMEKNIFLKKLSRRYYKFFFYYCPLAG